MGDQVEAGSHITFPRKRRPGITNDLRWHLIAYAYEEGAGGTWTIDP
jgi:hypothetical protein